MDDIKITVINELDSEYQIKIKELEDKISDIEKEEEKFDIEFIIESKVNPNNNCTMASYNSQINSYKEKIEDYKSQLKILVNKLNYLRLHKDEF